MERPSATSGGAAAADLAQMDDDDFALSTTSCSSELKHGLTSLPVEIHAQILSYLDPMDVLNYARVCRSASLLSCWGSCCSYSVKFSIFQGHCQGKRLQPSLEAAMDQAVKANSFHLHQRPGAADRFRDKFQRCLQAALEGPGQPNSGVWRLHTNKSELTCNGKS